MKVAVLVGSKSDLEHAEKVRARLVDLGVPCEVHVASAHRTPEKVDKIVADPEVDVFVAMAGLSAALPGAVAARTLKPVVGVPLDRGSGSIACSRSSRCPRESPSPRSGSTRPRTRRSSRPRSSG